MSDRRKIVAETIRDYQARRWVACEHTQLISFGGCADAVLAALDEHDAAEVERLRRAYNALTADRNRLAAQVRDLAAQGGRERDERDEARAEVERLSAELDARTDERDDAMNGWKKADTEAEQLREALDKTRDHRTYLQDRLSKAQKEAAGRKRYGDNLRTESERLLAEQVQRTEQAVHAFFADADQRGVHLDGMTVTELCDAVMAEIRKRPGR